VVLFLKLLLFNCSYYIIKFVVTDPLVLLITHFTKHSVISPCIALNRHHIETCFKLNSPARALCPKLISAFAMFEKTDEVRFEHLSKRGFRGFSVSHCGHTGFGIHSVYRHLSLQMRKWSELEAVHSYPVSDDNAWSFTFIPLCVFKKWCLSSETVS
jgi:hypothetical protein